MTNVCRRCPRSPSPDARVPNWSRCTHSGISLGLFLINAWFRDAVDVNYQRMAITGEELSGVSLFAFYRETSGCYQEPSAPIKEEFIGVCPTDLQLGQTVFDKKGRQTDRV